MNKPSRMVLARKKTQRDIPRSKVFYLKHVQPVHHHHSLDQVSSQINVPAMPPELALNQKYHPRSLQSQRRSLGRRLTPRQICYSARSHSMSPNALTLSSELRFLQIPQRS